MSVSLSLRQIRPNVHLFFRNTGQIYRIMIPSDCLEFRTYHVVMHIVCSPYITSESPSNPQFEFE
jgi:hypothetical protein